MQQVGGVTSTASLVPWADRVRSLAWFRVGVVTAATAVFAIEPQQWFRSPWPLLVTAGVYAILSFGLVLRLQTDPGRRRLAAFNSTLILDGGLLAWLLYETQWMESPLMPLVLLNVLVVTLGASYRTGLKMVLWHAIVLSIVGEAITIELIPQPGTTSPMASGRQLMWFVAAVAVTAAVTTGASHVNERLLKRNRFDLDRLTGMETDFQRATGPDDIAQTAVTAVMQTFPMRRVVLFGVQDDTVSYMASATQEDDAPVVQPQTALRRSESPALSAAGETQHVQLLATFDPGTTDWLADVLPDARNVIVVPMITEDALHGVLIGELKSARGGRVERQTVAMLTRFVRHASMALSNARLSARLRQEAQRDGLTGLPNRRTLDTTLSDELARAARNGTPTSVVLMDIDHFKALNDTHGHIVGDDVLKSVGGVLESVQRETDLAARYGGEEFVIVMPSTTEADALHAAGRIQQVLLDETGPVPTTMSIGVATASPGVVDGDALIGAADAAMYAAKRAGRARIMTAPNRVTPDTSGPGAERTATTSRPEQNVSIKLPDLLDETRKPRP